jgi:hypothetical protein
MQKTCRLNKIENEKNLDEFENWNYSISGNERTRTSRLCRPPFIFSRVSVLRETVGPLSCNDDLDFGS